MLPFERRQRSQGHGCEAAASIRFREYLLDHERVHVDQTYLKQ
jgi:hypothetical protein